MLLYNDHVLSSLRIEGRICLITTILNKAFVSLLPKSIWSRKNTVIPKRSPCFDLWVLLHSRQSSQSRGNIVIFMINNIMKQSRTVHWQHTNCGLQTLLVSPLNKCWERAFFFNSYVPMKPTITLGTHCFREEGNSRVYCLLHASDKYSSFLFIVFAFW